MHYAWIYETFLYLEHADIQKSTLQTILQCPLYSPLYIMVSLMEIAHGRNFNFYRFRLLILPTLTFVKFCYVTE